MKPIEEKQRTPLNSICFRGWTSEIQVRDFPILFVEGERCFHLHGSLSPSRKSGNLENIREKKHANFPSIKKQEVF